MAQLLDFDLYQFYKNYELIAIISLMVLILYPILLITRKLMTTVTVRLLKAIDSDYIAVLEQNQIYKRVLLLLSALYFIICRDIIQGFHLASEVFIVITHTIAKIFIIIAFTVLTTTLINIGVDIYKIKSLSKKFPIVLHAQIAKVIIICCAILAILSTVLGLSVSALFASIGAAAAVFTFVFKDTVTGLVASLQVTVQDVIRVGDWVSVAKHNIDGEVEKITITIVVIRGFDGATAIVPTSIFLTEAVKNNRPIFDRGCRRIKRAINLDADFIKIIDQDFLDSLKISPYTRKFMIENENLFNISDTLTNLTLFRHYINYYLKNNKDIYLGEFPNIARLMDPTPMGIPIEIYGFARETLFVNYENVQSSIFEHLIGIMPLFKLRIFQVATGNKASSEEK